MYLDIICSYYTYHSVSCTTRFFRGTQIPHALLPWEKIIYQKFYSFSFEVTHQQQYVLKSRFNFHFVTDRSDTWHYLQKQKCQGLYRWCAIFVVENLGRKALTSTFHNVRKNGKMSKINYPKNNVDLPLLNPLDLIKPLMVDSKVWTICNTVFNANQW